MKPFAAIGLTHFEPPLRRVLALDPGSRCLKLSLVELSFGRLRILREQSLDLLEEGLVSAAELGAHLQNLLEDLGRPPIALTLPQHLSTSQLMELPPASETEVKRLIEEEIVKLSGVSETAIIHDYTRLAPLANHRQQFWVTLCQEGDIREHIARLELTNEDLCEVTTTANALLAAYRAVGPAAANAVLVHLGAQSTVTVILVGGQGVFASSFPLGSDAFGRAMVHELKCPSETAETLKRTKNAFAGPDALVDFPGVVDGWFAELRRHWHEGFETRAATAPPLQKFSFIASGGGFAQQGLLEHLAQTSGLKFERWPVSGTPNVEYPARGFEVAYGTALQALGRSAQPASLLPADRRAAWKKRLLRQWTDFANGVLLVIVFCVLLFGTWQQWNRVRSKSALRDKVQAGLEHTLANESLSEQLAAEYEQLRPVLDQQQRTLDTLKTLALMQQSRSNRAFWYVLFADQHSYFTQPLPAPLAPVTGPTNAVAGATNAPPVALTNLIPMLTAFVSTNDLVAKPGFIAELCIPEDADAARRTLSQLVSDLKRDALFTKVDSLSDDLRRNLADSKTVLTDRHFALALELADTEFQRPLALKRRLAASPTNAVSRTAHRPPKPPAESIEALDPSKIP